jgi:hypothetical protein
VLPTPGKCFWSDKPENSATLATKFGRKEANIIVFYKVPDENRQKNKDN